MIATNTFLAHNQPTRRRNRNVRLLKNSPFVTILALVFAISACRQSPKQPPSHNLVNTKNPVTLIPREETDRGMTYIRLDAPDSLSNHAEEVNKIYEDFKDVAKRKNWRILNHWIHYRDESYSTSAMIYGIYIEHEPCNDQTQPAQPRRSSPKK
jgi:hypothetical protein